MPFKDISYLELWWPFCSANQNHLCNFGRGYYEEQFCEIILNLGQWFRCRFKDFLSGALAALLFIRVEPFMQFWKRASLETFMWSYMKFGPVVQEEMLFKEKVYGTRRTKTDHNSSSWAKKWREYCNRLCPLCYLLLNHWRKSNKIWCVSYSHEWGVQQHFIFAPPPGALRGGQKSLNFNYSQFQIFLYKTLCVFSQIKIKDLSNRIFIPWVMHAPGVGIGGVGWSKIFIFQTWSCGAGWWVEQKTSKIFTLESYWWPCSGVENH